MDNTQKRKLLDDLVEENRRRKNVKILTEYYPRSFHWKFLTDWRKQKNGSKIDLFIASNQVGKSTVGAILVRDIALGYHPWIENFANFVRDNWNKYKEGTCFWYKGQRIKSPRPGWWFRDKDHEDYMETAEEAYDFIMSFKMMDIRTPSKYAMCAKDFKKGVGVVFWPKLKEMVPGPYRDGPYIKKVIYMQGGVPESIEWENGSVTVFFSGEQDAFRFEGGTWDAIGWDEPPKQTHYVAMKRGGLVKSATQFFHLTPLSEPWIFDTLMEDAKDGGNSVSISNCNLMCEEVDWMTQEAKDDFEKEVRREDPHQVEARVYGRFAHLLGRIYPTYDENIHLISAEMVEKIMSETSVTYGVTVDPHDRRPFAIGFWFVDPSGDIYFYKNYPLLPMPEIKSCDLTVEQYATMIKDERDRLRNRKIVYLFGDPNKFPTPRKTQQHAGQTLTDDFALEELYFDVKINDSIAEGHRTVRSDYLYYDTEQPVSATNKPKIYVSEDCQNVHQSMMKYTWNEKKSKDIASEVPHEKYKDFADVVRYTCIKHPVHIEAEAAMLYNPPIKGRLYE